MSVCVRECVSVVCVCESDTVCVTQRGEGGPYVYFLWETEASSSEGVNRRSREMGLEKHFHTADCPMARALACANISEFSDIFLFSPSLYIPYPVVFPVSLSQVWPLMAATGPAPLFPAGGGGAGVLTAGGLRPPSWAKVLPGWGGVADQVGAPCLCPHLPSLCHSSNKHLMNMTSLGLPWASRLWNRPGPPPVAWGERAERGNPLLPVETECAGVGAASPVCPVCPGVVSVLPPSFAVRRPSNWS